MKGNLFKIPFKITSKRNKEIKCLGINLVVEVKDWYTKNHKILLKDI